MEKTQEAKSFAVGLSKSVAVTVLPETFILIFMCWVPSEEALCAITMNARPTATVSAVRRNSLASGFVKLNRVIVSFMQLALHVHIHDETGCVVIRVAAAS